VQWIIQKRCGIIDRKARLKSDRFSIFFRGCNQYKFIHITSTNVGIFLRLGSLYLKNILNDTERVTTFIKNIEAKWLTGFNKK
jgi:hypothetical protein